MQAMLAIRTKYFGPTGTRGSRIQAKCAAGSIHMPYQHELNVDGNHKAACALLVKKLKWDADGYGDMVGGYFDGAMYWVFDDKRLKVIKAWVALTRKATPSGNPWSKKEFRDMVECIARDAGFYGTALEYKFPDGAN